MDKREEYSCGLWRLQKWMKENEETQFGVSNHMMFEGIGLRQIIDYFYLLKSNTDSMDYAVFDKTLRYLGLMEMAGAMMWVMREVLGLEEKYLIAPVDERRGRFLYEEMMQGGNFGQYDQRVGHHGGQLSHNVRRLRRDVRLLRYFPSECLWEPVYRLWHFGWRVAHR